MSITEGSKFSLKAMSFTCIEKTQTPLSLLLSSAKTMLDYCNYFYLLYYTNFYEAISDFYGAISDPYEAISYFYEAKSDFYEAISDFYEAISDLYVAKSAFYRLRPTFMKQYLTCI